MAKLSPEAKILRGKVLKLASVVGITEALRQMGIGPTHTFYQLMRTLIPGDTDIGGNCLDIDDPTPHETSLCGPSGQSISLFDGVPSVRETLEFSIDAGLVFLAYLLIRKAVSRAPTSAHA